jgi:hypothetical protein
VTADDRKAVEDFLAETSDQTGTRMRDEVAGVFATDKARRRLRRGRGLQDSQNCRQCSLRIETECCSGSARHSVASGRCEQCWRGHGTQNPQR